MGQLGDNIWKTTSVKPIWETFGREVGHNWATSRTPPDWETSELLEGGTNEFETAKEPNTTSQTGRQMVCYKEETNELETAREKFFFSVNLL